MWSDTYFCLLIEVKMFALRTKKGLWYWSCEKTWHVQSSVYDNVSVTEIYLGGVSNLQ